MNEDRKLDRKRRPVTDLFPLLTRVAAENDLAPTTWARKAGHIGAFKDFGQRPDKSMRLDVLDDLAIYVGYDDFVHLATGHARFDRETMEIALATILRTAKELDTTFAPEAIAAGALNLYEALCDPKRDAKRREATAGEVMKALGIQPPSGSAP